MSPAWIRTRTRAGQQKRYQVLYRRGGRGWPIEHAGMFRTQKDAKIRRDLVAGWLAQGRDPRAMLAALQTPPPAVVTFKAAQAAMIRARVDVDPATTRTYKARGALLDQLVGAQPVDTLTAEDGQRLVTALSEHATERGTPMRPSSVAKYMGQARLVLDHARVDPNPFRDQAVRLPRQNYEEPSPPAADEVLAILDRVLPRHVLPLALLEQTGMRVGELRFGWGDVDAVNARLRLRRSGTKTNRPRWVQVPRWLMDLVEALCPPEDRTASRLVFPAATDSALRGAMAKACRAAKIPLYSPHDLRHRRISLWHGQGIPQKELSARVGHIRASETLDRYSHVMPLDEIPEGRYLEALTRWR